MGYVLTGDALRAPALIGPKLSRQAELARHGITVPPFFAVSATCYTDTLARFGPQLRQRFAAIDFDDAASVAEGSAALRALVLSTPPNGAAAAEILNAFDGLFGPDELVSVRSSTVGSRAGESEDSAENPFAGLSDTFLYVTRDEVLDRVHACWASGFNPESLLYRRTHGLDPLSVAVAVGVQRMVPGERSVVLFTCDPTTGARTPVVAAGYGVGEGVVQEKVAVDHYFVDPASGTVTSRIARKTERVDRGPDGGTALLPVEADLRERPVLSAAELAALVRLGERIETLLGGPQDIEATLTGDGALHVLQARPVVLDLSRQRLWSNANVTESFPGVTTALTYSFAQEFYRTIFFDLYRWLGVDARGIHRHEPHLHRMIGLLHGRVYYSLTSWYQLHRQVPLFALGRAHWERMMGLTTSPESRRDTLGAGGRARSRVRHWWALGRSAARVVYLLATHDRAARRFTGWWDALARPLRPPVPGFADPGAPAGLAAADPLARTDEFHRIWCEVGDHWGFTLVNDLLLTFFTGVTTTALRRWAPAAVADTPGLLGDLLCGGEENRSVAAVASLVRLAEQARADADLSRALAGATSEATAAALWPSVRDGRFGPEFGAAVRSHLERFGDRGLEELKLERPTPRQRPHLLLPMISGYLRSDVTAAGLAEREEGIRAAAQARLTEALRRAPVRRAVLNGLLARLRRYIRYREDSRFCRTELFGYARETYLALGAALVADGALAHPEDVVHLTHQEIFGYVDGTGVSTDLAGLVEVRRREFATAGAELPVSFATMGTVPVSLPSAPPAGRWSGAAGHPAESAGVGEVLRGLGSSSGRVRGTARVVLDPYQGVDCAEGTILVARETDPGWLFLMLRARGMVVERGTLLSHTAITGRKFGIPTVVALPGATARIPDGAHIEVDGASGTVRILAEASS